MVSKVSKTYKAVSTCYETVLTGTMLSIDPSTGSKSSRPGYAWYEAGVLKESGEITVDITANRAKRLYEISRTIREEFPVPDILAVEYIPPITYKGGNQMNGVALMALQKAIGAVMSTHPYEHLLEIPAAAWIHHKPDDYIKTDEWDAITIGLCVVNIAKQIKLDKQNK